MALFDKLRNRTSGPADSPEQIAAAVNRDYSDHVIPVDPEGPLYGAVAQGLALSGPMAMASDTPWNSQSQVGSATVPFDAKYTLTKVWGIRNAEEWMRALGLLLDCQYGDALAYQAADIRTKAKRQRDVPILDDATWTQELINESARLGAPEGYSDVLAASIPGIRAAEDTLRQARLLAADEEVEALSGYDLVRVGNLARWGVAMGWGEPHVVANVAVAAHDSVLVNHSSWRSYALSVSAGRIVTYPDSWGREIVDAIEWVRPFLDSRHSPWNHLPFPDAPVIGDN